MKKRNNKKYALALVLLLIGCITIGYAALETGLNITGTSTIGENSTWDVHFENVKLGANNTILKAGELPAINTEKTSVTYTASLTAPGDVVEFTVDVVNKGGIAAKAEADNTLVLTATDSELQDELEAAIDYSATEIAAEEALAASNGKKTITLAVKFKDSITNAQFNAVAGAEFTVTYDVTYVQA